MTFGERVAYLRKRRGLSQASLGKKLNVGSSTLGMWETNKRKPGPDIIVQIADYFGVTTDYLLGHKTDLGDTPVAAHYTDDDIDEETQKEIDEYIEFKKAQYKKRMENKKD